MQIGGNRFFSVKKGSHGTCEHTRTHDLDLQVPEESLSGLVPGAAGVDLDVGQLHGLLIPDFEDNLVADGYAVDVLGAHQGLRNLKVYLIFVIFFTRAKFLENKIYTKKRQFFALNL